MFEQLLKGLARKGHQVDVISPFPLEKSYPNYTDIVKIKAPHAFVNNVTYEFMQHLFSVNPVYAIAILAGNEICKNLENPAILELARNPPKDPPYDAILMEVRE